MGTSSCVLRPPQLRWYLQQLNPSTAQKAAISSWKNLSRFLIGQCRPDLYQFEEGEIQKTATCQHKAGTDFLLFCSRVWHSTWQAVGIYKMFVKWINGQVIQWNQLIPSCSFSSLSKHKCLGGAWVFAPSPSASFPYGSILWNLLMNVLWVKISLWKV